MIEPYATATLFADGERRYGLARCRAGHTRELPDPQIGDWCADHEQCRRPADGPEQNVAVPARALRDLITVAAYVSLGRGAIGHQPDAAPYPDAAARLALGALHDAGIDPAKAGA